MNKSERLLSVFSEDYFFKELIFDDLEFIPDDTTDTKFIPKGATTLELADLIINMQDVIVAIQLKERNASKQTFDIKRETKWLEKKCRIAKGQVKQTLAHISSGNLPPFRNKKGQLIKFRSDAEVIPLVVFENKLINSYPHLLKKHSESGSNINCISFDDFSEMCRILISPREIVDYLRYRKNFFEKHGEVDLMILDGDNESIITKPTCNESLVYNFLAEIYSIQEANQQIESLCFFNYFLQHLSEHTIESSVENGYYDILLFLAHMDRLEISNFCSRLRDAIAEAQKGTKGILRSMRPTSNAYVVLFVADQLVPLDVIIPVVKEKADVNRILEISICWTSVDDFSIDFLYWDNN